MIELALKLRSTSKDELAQNTAITEQILWLGKSLLSTKNAPKSDIMQKIAKKVYKSLLKGQEDTKALLMANSDSLFYILLLGLLLADMPGDAELTDCLVE